MKNSMRLIFSSASVTARQDLHDTIKGDLRDLKFEIRRNNLIESILHDDTSGITTAHYTDHDIIVSLTSYGRRIHEVALTIESLMQQTMKANRIVLWLSDDLAGRRIPQALVKQQQRGLEIKYCKDIRSYTKLIPQLKESPENAIITVDDDILYDNDCLEHLITAYLQQPSVIHCCRVHRMLFDERGKILPYNQWKWTCSEEGVDNHFFLTGCGGVLYPPYCLDEEALNESVFLDICPEADDVWFTAMALKKGTPINKVFTRNEFGEDYIKNPTSLERGLSVRNVDQSGNDRQIHAVFSKYAIFDMLM